MIIQEATAVSSYLSFRLFPYLFTALVARNVGIL